MTKRDARSDQGWSLTRFLVHIEGPNVFARCQWLIGPRLDAATILDTHKPVQAAENSEQTFQSPIVQRTLSCLLLHGFQQQ